ncbi:hypothetical protein H6G54_14680 [Anabaena cylindrica FACHB-243]|uniref:Uncharacterized protein n=1 Tax=Anabaena cylindrica (strain ATCC 27899 / PCC 7122) TaxID=272123 RepID=K9ZPS6_ANACC|nr:MULTISPECIES: hypothetical protein [Anabaena]AFZ60350.1 hypothetical protein Anacy_5010 [Anabaena cylindrica PCC 7122]MBD2418924.1 hypothetical protein [Anabaena cylindrica FACHB-243]MBY5284852.1 hypothetical protein [Anabaena sp. CCAP 1446/1C]MBY5309460.1 hypothetical protein [Anabaena sp. CCAP 1446/1C]MCM2404515.1 hypothetical protein [Anabaena sp. CCAP 1446/1C]
MRLKRWESPRKEGRNDKGRGGSARKRQLKKQRQMLRNKLKEAQKAEKNQNNQQKREGIFTFPLFLGFPQTKIKTYASITLNISGRCF